MNILITAPNFFPHSFGGGEIYVYRIAKELMKRGHNIAIMISVKWRGGKGTYVVDRYHYENIPVVTLSISPEAASFLERSTGFGPQTFQIISEILNDFAPEIVHINGIKPAMVSLCNAMDIPHVVTVHHTGIVCPAGGLLRPDYSICGNPANPHDCIPCCGYFKRPKWHIGGILGRIPTFIYRPLGKRLGQSQKLSYFERGLIYPWLIEQVIIGEKIVLEQAQLIIAPSLAMRDLLIRNGCDTSKIVVISHGIEPVSKGPFEDIKGRPIRFGYMGRIDPSKGLHIMLEAAELLQDGPLFELHIFGAARNPWDEEYRKKSLSGFRGKAKVFDHGLIAHDKLLEVFAKIDILVVPSILPEAFGLVVAEAFSAGRPVIVFNSGALPEQVKDGVNGFIVERNDTRALSEAMQKFIDNPDLVLDMSKQIFQVKTMQEYVDEIEKIYSNIIHKQHEAVID